MLDAAGVRGLSLLSLADVPAFDEAPETGATFEDKHFSVPTDYLLGIRTKQDARGLAALVENRDEFKLMPKSMIERAYFGLPMKEERHPPLELPAAAAAKPDFVKLAVGHYKKMWPIGQWLWDEVSR